MTKTFALTAAAALMAATTLAGTAFAQTRDTIQIAGSSTVLPFASIVAEEFGNAYPDFKTPVVGSGGTSGGLRQFCEGVGETTIDIANASRRMKPAEIEACNTAGVTKIIEVKVGYDGIVFASDSKHGDFALQPLFVYKALAAKVPQGGQMVDNPYTNWKDIDPSLPDQEIRLAIPASNHGTREVFEEKVVLPGCKEAGLPEMAKEQLDATCKTFRQDRVTEIAGDYTETLARLDANPETVGVFGLSFYEQNRDRLKVASVGGIAPSVATVADGTYPVSRPLYFYIKGEHIGVIPGLEDYAQFFLSDEMAGAGGRLEAAGMIPAPAEELAAQRSNVEAKKTLSPADLQG